MATVATVKKNIVLRVDPDEHQELKEYVVKNKISLQDYIMGLIRTDQANKKKEGKE